MNIQEIISSGLLESYVLGTTSAQENDLVNDLCKKDPAILKEIELIEEALMNYSSQNSKPLSNNLKHQISAKLFSKEKQSETKIIPIQNINVTNKAIAFYKFGMAASIIFIIAGAVYVFFLNQKFNAVKDELAKTETSKNNLEQQLNTQQTDLIVIKSELQILSDPKIKTIGLKGMNALASQSALVHWNSETNAVYFNAAALPDTPSNKQYQLWAIVDGKPVDAGMIDLTNETVFQKMKPVKGAQAFAVTIEKAGGSPTPTMDTMCLLGNV